MKKVIVLLSVLFFSSIAYTEPGVYSQPTQKDKPATICPKTKMVESCTTCHVGSDFRIKETKPDAHIDYPNYTTKIIGWETGNLKGYFLLEAINSDMLSNALKFFRQHHIKYITIEIFSPGGSVMHAWRMIGMIRQFESEGNIIETRVNGMALSAGFMLFISGTKGYRYINPQAELMAHELMSFKLFDIATPSSKQREADILRHLQDTIDFYIVSRSNVTKEELEKYTKDWGEWWVRGTDAIKYGFADKLIGE